MKLALATNNANKVREIKAILGNHFEEIRCLKELNIDIDVEETGATFEENALLKARAIKSFVGSDFGVLADDSGLCVEALGGAPGVYSARYAGENHDDEENIALLLRNMKDKSDRRAKFVTTMALILPDGREILSYGETAGEILSEKTGNGGFGYDPVFYSYDLKKSFGLAKPEEKNSVSHRARALNDMETKLRRSI